MKKLSPEAELLKYEKDRRAHYVTLKNRVMSAWSFGKIKTFKDYIIILGYDDEHIARYFDFELNEVLNIEKLKDLLLDIKCSIEAEIFLKKNPPELTYDTGTIKTEVLQSTDNNVLALSKHQSKDSKQVIPNESKSEDELPPSPNEKVFLFWFQKKACKQLLDGILKYEKHGQLLVAGAGTGKTYIYGALLRRLLDVEFHKGKTFSPWPYCVITKASVIEQTKRVLRDSFGIDTIYQCLVTSYDQMRAKFGELFVKDKTVVVNGEEQIEWEWKPAIHPIVFIIDESQAAKNEISQQSQIICSLSKIPNKNIFTVFSSATPFTRVSEAKYFVINTKHDEKGLV